MNDVARGIRAVGNLLTLLTFTALVLAPVFERSGATAGPALPTSASGWSAWPGQFESWFRDNFFGRDQLLALNTKVMVEAFGLSPSEQVVLGEEGWLYYTRDGILPDRRGEVRLREWELVNWRSALETRREWLRQRGVPYVFAVAPNKVTVYPQYLPARMRERPALPTRLDQLSEWLRANSQFPLLDLRATLIPAANGELLYHRRDSHWNELGAHRAYETILTAFRERGTDRKSLSRADLVLRSRKHEGDLVRLVAAADWPLEDVPVLEPSGGWTARQVPLSFDWKALPAAFGVWEEPVAFECAAAEGTLLVIGDSYQWAMRPLLANHFRRSVFVCASVTELDVFVAMVAAVQPSAVLEMRVERNMRYTPRWHSLSGK